MQGGLEFLKTLGAARLAAMGAVGAGLIGFFAFLILYFSSETMVPIYSDLDYDDSGAIVQELERRGIPYELRYDGSTVLVPEGDMLRLRMDLASEGLPTGGGVGYEIFDRGDTLGATSFVQNINHLRALEGELSRTIKELDRVTAARVHLVIPERRLFAQDAVSPSASIVVKTRGSLDNAQIRAIRHLVASAVEGLIPARVSVVDDTGRLLADGSGEEDPGSASALDERRQSIERQLRSQIESIVASVVGSDRVRVQVAAELNFNRVTETTDKYDPEGRVVRSSQVREENSTSKEGAPNGEASVGSELPGADAANDATATNQNATTTEEVTNYEISRTTKTEVIEPGRIKRLSVAVVVDGVYTQDANGETVYEARPQDQLDRIAALVRSAIGFDNERGDSVEVANLRFAATPQTLPLETNDSFLPTFTKADFMRFAELGVLFLLGMLVLLFVARPLVRRILTPDHTATGTAVVPADSLASRSTDRDDGDRQTPRLAGPQSQQQSVNVPVPQTFEAINFAQQVGEVQAASLKKVGELIEQNPNEALTIIRNWIHEPAA